MNTRIGPVADIHPSHTMATRITSMTGTYTIPTMVIPMNMSYRFLTRILIHVRRLIPVQVIIPVIFMDLIAAMKPFLTELIPTTLSMDICIFHTKLTVTITGLWL